METCVSCGFRMPADETVPNMTPFWEPIGDERVCKDPEACFERKFADILG